LRGLIPIILNGASNFSNPYIRSLIVVENVRMDDSTINNIKRHIVSIPSCIFSGENKRYMAIMNTKKYDKGKIFLNKVIGDICAIIRTKSIPREARVIALVVFNANMPMLKSNTNTILIRGSNACTGVFFS